MGNTGKSITKFVFRIGAIIIALLFIGWVSYETWSLTVHTVIPQKIYRSAQLPASALEYFVKTKHIKTVINMRGPHPNTKWYQEEVIAMKKLGVNHYDIAMHSYKLPTKERMRELVYLLMTSPKPILVHCSGGADRSGLASAFAIILNGNPSLNKSEQQFSLAHFVTSKRSVGKLVFPYYIRWLSQNHLEHSRRNFLRWLCTEDPFDSSGTQLNLKLDNYNQLVINKVCDTPIQNAE